MEELMLGTRRTIAFWRPKKRLLILERALAPDRMDTGNGAITARALAEARARDRMAAESKRKGRFSELTTT
jgi:hypothetical protein